MNAWGRAGELLAAAVEHLVVATPDELSSALTRSHLDDGRTIGWTGPVPSGWTLVIDAEYATADVPAGLTGQFGKDHFWQRWTQAECACKLADVPMLVWWPEHGLGIPAGFTGLWRTLILPEDRVLVVTVAARPNH